MKKVSLNKFFQVLAGDLGYVIVFPQFFAAVHLSQHVNVFGSVAAALLGTILRILIGEPLFGLKAVLEVPTFDDGSPKLPIKTLLMLSSFATLFLVSKISSRRRL